MSRVPATVKGRTVCASAAALVILATGGVAAAQTTCLACGPATLSLSPLVSTGGGSGDLTLQATFTNNTDAPIFLNGDGWGYGSTLWPYVTEVNDTLFFESSPSFVAAHSAATFDALDVKYASAQDGLYNVLGYYEIFTGPDDQSTIPVVANQVYLQVSGAAVPEPTTWSILLLGLGGAGALLRSYRRRPTSDVGVA